MNWEREIISAAAISFTYLIIFTVAELWRKFGKPTSELTRKLVHFASGAACLPFAYIFTSHWTVLTLSAAFFVIMIVTKKTGLLSSVHDINRKTSGDVFYPLAVYLIFIIARIFNQPHYYLISIMVLAVSDSMAALIGQRYGFKVYRVEEDNKSLEGSIIFFTATFIIVLLGLLLLTPIGREQCVLIAIYLALLVTGFESISLGGTDNLFIPLGTIAVLVKVDEQSAFQTTLQIGILIGLFILISLIARRTQRLGLSAIIGIVLTGYAASSLIAFHWVFPILIGIILFSFIDLFLDDSKDGETIYRIRSIFFILVVSFIWILVGDFFGKFAFLFYVSYTTNITANFGILWHRKSRLVKKGMCGSKMPDFLCHAPLPVRAFFLSVCFIPATVLFDPVISLPFSLGACYIGTICIELVYWLIEPSKKGVWKRITFLRFSSAISITVTSLLSFASWWYYYDKFELLFEKVVLHFLNLISVFV